MKLKSRISLFLLLCFSAISFAQLDTYDYKVEIKGITNQWHSLVIPQDVFEKTNSNLSDIRIYGLMEQDTIEAPYILKSGLKKSISNNIDFKLLNTSSQQNNYFFTLEITKTELINEILLDFENENFDWHIKMEASQNQNEWFTILEDYRILSITNKKTDFTFSQLLFPSSKYKYYRIKIKSDTRPLLNKAFIAQEDKVELKYEEYKKFTYETNEDEKINQTVIHVQMNQRYPINTINLKVANTFDYYRPIQIQYAVDSVKSEKEWRFRYLDLYHGTLNSFQSSEFKFESVLSKRFKITILNHDNQPLQISGLAIKGVEYKLIARFTEDADYYLTYGKKNMRKPNYDISKSIKKIPAALIPLKLGNEQIIPKADAQVNSPLFENKFWLWAIMGVVILVLSGFTMKMMAKK